MVLIYNAGIFFIDLFISIGALFSSKLKLLKEGRKATRIMLEDIEGPVIWIHAASLGEFEQGRPVIEAIKKHLPEKKILLTFFSPSGYEVRKDYEFADYVVYLPADTRQNAIRFINAVKPEMAFFVKYEFWYHFITQLSKKDIPVYGISVLFRKDQPFFKWYGGLFRKMLKAFTHLYVQDESSAKLLDGIGISNYTVAGDTRFDRVREIAESASDIDIAEKFAGGSRTIVAGSTWPPDEKILLKYINETEEVKLIIAPHEIDESHIKQIETALKVPYFRITSPPDDVESRRVMIVDTIGMLAAIYRYGQIAYVGGGFTSGIHNTLEPATYGMPVIFGPDYKKYKEACDLVELGGGFEVKDYREFRQLVSKMWSDDEFLEKSSKASGEYVAGMCGATAKIMKDIFSVEI
ncbi:MAG: 3-deoxy-D-manno-octulosonic acid transferase [Chlorobi bacterium]|nr:3-deoxy-D-manno-octulosonic acid transferase [Chlorobiota bacterium]